MWRGLHRHRRTVGRGDRGDAREVCECWFRSADRQQQRNRQSMKHQADQAEVASLEALGESGQSLAIHGIVACSQQTGNLPRRIETVRVDEYV